MAFVMDLFLLFVALVVMLAVSEDAGVSKAFFAFLVPALFAAHQVASVLRPNLSLGRTAMAISVVSARRNESLTTRQAVIRSIVRTGMYAGGVVLAFSQSQQWLAVVAPLFDLLLITFTPWKTTIADFVASTVVVNTPPMQPHRAPAVPMYSKDDAEFGPPPRKDG